MMHAILEEVQGLTRKKPIVIGDSFFDDFDKKILEICTKLNIYKREKEKSPFDREEWVIDIHTKTGGIFCIRVPTKYDGGLFEEYIDPLIKEVKSIQNLVFIFNKGDSNEKKSKYH